VTTEQRAEIRQIVRSNLDAAEDRWGKVGALLKQARALESARKGALVPTKFPGVSFVDSDVPLVRQFVAFMADMRGSTSHLRAAAGMESGIQRLYYETSALLPVLTKMVTIHGGSVTEYAGDGILALRPVGDDPTSKELRAMIDAGDDCLEATEDVINPILRDRYGLPSLGIGVGIAFGPVLLSVIGPDGDLRPLGFGEAVFDASKLSKAENKVVIHQSLRDAWPKKKGGTTQFTPISVKGAFGYTVAFG
jgi:class 3 adenylate cyclase